MTSRRVFLTAVLALASARLAAQDKAAKVYRIGVLEPVSLQANGANMEQFLKGLKDLGYSEGNNLAIEYLSAEGRIERFARLARDLVSHDVALIVTSGTPATLAAMKASVAVLTEELEAKRLELLLAIAPSGSKRVAAIMDMSNPGFAEAWKAMQPAATRLGMELELIDV